MAGSSSRPSLSGTPCLLPGAFPTWEGDPFLQGPGKQNIPWAMAGDSGTVLDIIINIIPGGIILKKSSGNITIQDMRVI